MKVWIESAFDNLPHEGFRKQRYWLMAEAFAAAGHETTYFTCDFNHGTKSRRVLSAPIESAVKPVMIPVLPYAKNVSLKRVISHRAYARDLAKKMRTMAKPDLIVVATPPLSSSIAALDYAREAGAKFALDIQDAWPETFYRLLPSALKWLGKLAFAPMEAQAKRLYAEADAITGVAERYRVLAQRDDYRLFRHGIEPTSPIASPSAAPRHLVYLGNLGEGYDLRTVIDAVNADERLTLDIAGKGPREAELGKFASERIRFHGYLGAAATRELLSKCEVGVIPMRDDSWVGLPYKLGDYLVAGLRVVSSLHGECGELIEREGVGATYDFGSPDSLRQALGRLRAGVSHLPDSLRADLIYPAYVRALS